MRDPRYTPLSAIEEVYYASEAGIRMGRRQQPRFFVDNALALFEPSAIADFGETYQDCDLRVAFRILADQGFDLILDDTFETRSSRGGKEFLFTLHGRKSDGLVVQLVALDGKLEEATVFGLIGVPPAEAMNFDNTFLLDDGSGDGVRLALVERAPALLDTVIDMVAKANGYPSPRWGLKWDASGLHHYLETVLMCFEERTHQARRRDTGSELLEKRKSRLSPEWADVMDVERKRVPDIPQATSRTDGEPCARKRIVVYQTRPGMR